MKPVSRQRWILGVWLCALPALAWAMYWPGLQGDFLFDDFANLPALGRYGAVQDWDGLLRYLTSGIADPTGRPVSMLSFLLDARGWPADPYPFKRTNLLLHAANGLLLYSVLVALGRHVSADVVRVRRAALVAAALWLLHPLWASTVLYVIQRQAMLAAFFVLAGIRTWIASQDAFSRGEIRSGAWLSLLAVPVLGVLAGLSKMNGFLLPLLLWALHASVLGRSSIAGSSPRGAKPAMLARGWLVYLPAALTVATLAWMGFSAAMGSNGGRPWTVGERLLTQPRALFDYLERLFVPGLDTTGIFADGFALSTGWLQPATTLPAILALGALAAAAWLLRKRWPLFSLAILFFLAGHAMESSVVPLELYFEHRNYLPAALLFWPLAWALSRPGRYLPLQMLLALGLVALCAAATLAQARLWGEPDALAAAWARALPASPRAQAHAANRDLAAGRIGNAILRLEPLAARQPDEPQYALTLLDARCSTGQVPVDDLRDAETSIAHRGLANDVVNQWLVRLLSPERAAPCAGLPDASIQALHGAATRAGVPPAGTESRSRRTNIDALMALRSGQCTDALALFNARLDIQRRPEFAHQQVAVLARHCGPASGLAHLDHYLSGAARGDAPAASPMLRLRDRIIVRQRFWDEEWTRLRGVLEEDIAASNASG